MQWNISGTEKNLIFIRILFMTVDINCIFTDKKVYFSTPDLHLGLERNVIFLKDSHESSFGLGEIPFVYEYSHFL